jgi:hypothetical protein
MKTKSLTLKIVFFISMVIFLSLTGFMTDPGKSGSVDLTKDAQLKENVFHQIMNNRELFNEFMNDMMQNPQSIQWMMNNQGMMQYMYSGNSMGYMMDNYPGMRQMMMQNMMNTIWSDSTYTYQWNQMMMNHSNNMHHGNM